MQKKIAWLVTLCAVALSACTAGQPETASPSDTPPPVQAATDTPTASAPQEVEGTTAGPCEVVSAGGATAYKRPDLQAEIFGQVPDDGPLPVTGLTQEGWIGFEPGVAQAGNIGLFRLRWLPPGSGSFQGNCGNLATLPTLPAQVCFTMAMGEVPIYAAASEDSSVIGSLQTNAYASVVSRTPDGWLQLDLDVSSMGLTGPGWIHAGTANFNGPCSSFAPALDATPIGRLAGGSAIEVDEIHMTGRSRGWAVGGLPDSDRHILRTDDGGNTWVDVTPPEPSSSPGSNPKLASASFEASGEARVVYWYSQPDQAPLVLSLWLTRDWGSSWQSAGTRRYSDLAEDPPLIEFTDGGTGLILVRFFVGMGNHAYALLASSDGGQNYTTLIEAQDFVDTCQRNSLVLFDALAGWMTGACPFLVDAGALLETTHDAGASWEQVGLPAPPLEGIASETVLFCEAADPQIFSQADGQVVVRCHGQGETDLASYLYRTLDGGGTWQVAAVPAPTVFFLDSLHGWALGRDIYWTEDGGRNWQARKTVTWQGQFNLVDAEYGWAVARSASETALVHTVDGGASWSLIEAVIASP